MSWLKRNRLWIIAGAACLISGLMVGGFGVTDFARDAPAQNRPEPTGGKPTQSAEQRTQEWKQRLEGYRADRGLEKRNAHPGVPAVSGDQIAIDENANLSEVLPPNLDIGWNEVQGVAFVRVVMGQEMYMRLLSRLNLDHATNPDRLIMSEGVADQMINLHEVYAQIFALSDGRNPRKILYTIAVQQGTANV